MLPFLIMLDMWERERRTEKEAENKETMSGVVFSKMTKVRPFPALQAFIKASKPLLSYLMIS